MVKLKNWVVLWKHIWNVEKTSTCLRFTHARVYCTAIWRVFEIVLHVVRALVYKFISITITIT